MEQQIGTCHQLLLHLLLHCLYLRHLCKVFYQATDLYCFFLIKYAGIAPTSPLISSPIAKEELPVPGSVREWLQQIKLDKYIEHFEKAEVTELPMLAYLDDAALDAMEIKALIPRRMLLGEAVKLLNKHK